MSIAPPTSAETLPSADLPADHGLSGLALLTQLSGIVFGALTAMFGLFALMAGGASSMWLILVIGAGIARAMSHRTFGYQLLYGPAARSALSRYLLLSLVQVGLLIAMLTSLGVASPGPVFSVVLLFGGWPVVLWTLLRSSRYQALLDAPLPLGEDKGFEGASNLMALFGATGLCVTLFLLYTMVLVPRAVGNGMILMFVVAVLALRSVLHLVAAWRGLGGKRIDQVTEATTRYANYAVISAILLSGALFLLGGMMSGEGLITLAAGLCLLMAWPLIVRRFFVERQFADMVEGHGHRRAPDRGLTAVGWLLLGTNMLGLATSLPEALFREAESAFGAPWTFNTLELGSPWWNVGLAALGTWAGAELLRMTPRHRIVASVWGVASIGLTLLMMNRLGGAFATMSPGSFDLPMDSLQAATAIALILPMGTLILVNRTHVPTAQARIRRSENG